MSQKEVVNWHVPFLPILAHVVRVPPVAVETTVREVCQLCKDVRVGVEDQVEVSEPDVSGGD